MRKILALLACGALLCLGMATVSAPAEARKGGIRAGSHGVGHARAARGFRGGGVNRRHIANRHIGHRRHRHRRGRVIWRTVTPALAGAAFVASCSYEYRQWQRTGSVHWRNRYYACAN